MKHLARLLAAAPAAVLIGLCTANPASAENWEDWDDDTQAEIIGSVTNDFYHEFGHALSSLMNIPVLGAEEDAADALSVFLVNEFWEEAPADMIMRASLASWASMAEQDISDFDFYDEHAPNAKRLATMACLFYGANPEERVQFADDLGIPEERREDCVVDFDAMHETWGIYIDQLTEAGPGETVAFLEPDEDTPLTEAIQGEVDYLNSILSLPSPLLVTVEPCGEANASFDGATDTITICTELAEEVAARMEQ